MKENRIFEHKLRIMYPLTVLFLLVLSSSIAFGQQKTDKLTVTFNGISLSDAMKKIESMTTYTFFYDKNKIDLNSKVSLNVQNADINMAMGKMLNASNISYEISNRQIALFPKRVASAPSLKRISGQVLDEAGSPIIGATVTIKNTSKGVITTLDGKYSIEAMETDALMVAFVGFVTQNIAVGSRTEINITLKEDIMTLNDVVVVGYGVQKKVNLTGSVAAVNIDDKMTSRSLPNVSSALSGLIPGLSVSSTTGMAGKDNSALQIRGLGTVNNSNPLIVIDGMPDMDINKLNMNDVESISVLKDAASASVYGSRAANGVILITTKTGSGANGKTILTFNGSQTVRQPIRTGEMLTDYARNMLGQIHAMENAGKTSSYAYATVEEWAAMSYIDSKKYPNTDWIDVTSRNASIANYNLSAQGGTEKSNFYISAGLMNQTDFMIETDYKRYNALFNYDYKIRRNIKVGAKFEGAWTKWRYSNDDGLFTNSASGGMISAIPGIYPYDSETNRYGGSMAYGEGATIYNPYRQIKELVRDRNDQHIMARTYIEWEPISGLKAAVDYSINYINTFLKHYNKSAHGEWNFQTGQQIRELVGKNSMNINNNSTLNYRTLLNARLEYNKSVKKHDISALALYSEEYAFTRQLNAGRDSRIHESVTEIDAALPEVQRANGSSSSWGLRSYIGKVNYSYNDRYLFEATLRADGSSKFVGKLKYGYFPSVAVGWRFTEEDFIRRYTKSVLSYGKLRASYGEVGNNSGVGNFEQQQTLSNVAYNFGNKLAQGFVNKKMINLDLSWETTRVINLGLDLGFLDQRLTAEIDYYNRLTMDMIRPSDLSTLLSGFSAPRINVGNMRNSGIEVNLVWKEKRGDFFYSIGLNGSYNRNRLEKWNQYLNPGNVFLDMPYGFVYTPMNIGGIVQSWQEIMDAPNAGAGAVPGRTILADLNGDGAPGDAKAFPNKMFNAPNLHYGINLYVSWKGIDVSALFQGTGGRKDYWVSHLNQSNVLNATGNTMAMSAMQYYNSWNYDNRGAMLPLFGASGTGVGGASMWLDDMSYLRLKNLQIGYNLPQRWMNKMKIGNVRFYISGENLFTWSKFRGIDPESYNRGSGSENDLFPMFKSYSFGINITI